MLNLNFCELGHELTRRFKPCKSVMRHILVTFRNINILLSLDNIASKEYLNISGHATPEYCSDGLVFNEELGYCDFPDNVDTC